ncbi:MAG: permease, partial [Cyanobacteriota bacterium]
MVQIATAWALFQGLLIEALPFLLIGVVIASLARWWSPGGEWLRRLPPHPVLGPLSGAALGFALPACECGNVPVARRMLVGGAPMGSALGFLFAAPVLNPIVLLSTWAAFHPLVLLAGFALLLIALLQLVLGLKQRQADAERTGLRRDRRQAFFSGAIAVL